MIKIKTKTFIVIWLFILIGMIVGIVLFLNKPRLISPSIDFGYELKEEDFTIQKIIPEEIEDVEIFAYDFKLSSGQPESRNFNTL